MGEFDDGTMAESGESKPAEGENGPSGALPEVPPVEATSEPPGEEPAAQPAAETPPAEGPSEEPTADEPPAEPPADEPPADEPPADEPVEASPPAAVQDQLPLDVPEPPAVEATVDADSDADSDSDTETETSDDDLAAAIAASSEQVGTEGTLDDIAPGTTHDEPADAVEEETLARYGAPWWPFVVYLLLWFVFAGIAVWQLQQLPQTVIVYETEQYTMFVYGGLGLAASGILLVFGVWVASRMNPERHRKGLFSSSLIMGALVILIGVLVWWAAIMALDYLRLGRLL